MQKQMKAGWSGTWLDFFNTKYPDFTQQLQQFYQQLPWTPNTPSSAQLHAWQIEFEVMQHCLRQVVQQDVNPNLAQQCWITFEQELVGEAGKRAADVNLVLPTGHFFVVEFKNKLQASEAEIWRANFDYQTMQYFHSESVDLIGHAFLVLTRPEAQRFVHDVVQCDVINAQQTLPQLTDALIRALQSPHTYDVQKWQHGTFYRQPSILAGTIQAFLMKEMPTLKTDAVDNIEQARQALLNVYQQAKQNKKHYVVMVHGRPGAGKTLLGISAMAELAQRNPDETPLLISGNAALIDVLRYTFEFYSKEKKYNAAIYKSFLEHLINFKKSLTERRSHFTVFDEAQRAWEHVRNGGSEIALLLDWFAQQEFGVLVFLVGDGQAIHTNEMNLETMLSQFNEALMAHQGKIQAILPKTYQHHFADNLIVSNDVFALHTPIRQSYTDDLDKWIEAVLHHQPESAQQFANQIQSVYPLVISDKRATIEQYARDLQTVLTEDKQSVNAFRMGWLQSSSSSQKPIPEMARNNSLQLGQWYVLPPTDAASCCQFKLACSEFSCQGLELSLALVCWGDDWVYRGNELQRSDFCKRDSLYLEGSYRVLLSRGRNGLLVWCQDKETLAYLQKCGMKLI